MGSESNKKEEGAMTTMSPSNHTSNDLNAVYQRVSCLLTMPQSEAEELNMYVFGDISDPVCRKPYRMHLLKEELPPASLPWKKPLPPAGHSHSSESHLFLYHSSGYDNVNVRLCVCGPMSL